MEKIGEINKKTENKNIIIIVSMILIVLLGTIIWLFYPLNYISMIDYNNITQIIIIPIAITITLIIHETIHILLFKLYGRGEAIIKVKWIKNEGSIVVHQLNDSIIYSRSEVIIILLSPFLIITFISLVLLRITTIPLLIYINCMLNIAGSSTDIFLSFKLLLKYKKAKKIRFVYKGNMNMCIYN